MVDVNVDVAKYSNFELLLKCIQKFKNQIILQNNKIASKSSEVWEAISKDLEYIAKAKTIYSMIICNRRGLKDLLLGSKSSNVEDTSGNAVAPSDEVRNIDNSNDESVNTSVEDTPSNIIRFTVAMPRSEYKNLIITKNYRRKEKNKSTLTTRCQQVLQPDAWQHVITQKIWESTKIPCGFNYKQHKLTENGMSGLAYGVCDCGSIIKLSIENPEEHMLTIIKCELTEKNGRCGKRYLRNPIRREIAEEISKQSILKYRSKEADKLMDDGDAEPPHLYTLCIHHQCLVH